MSTPDRTAWPDHTNRRRRPTAEAYDQPAVRRDQTAREIGGHLLALYGWKIEREKGIFGHGGVALSLLRQKCAGKRISSRCQRLTPRSPSYPLAVSRVEDWRASFRVRWLIRRFRSGPQSGSRCRVSSPRSPNPACRFPAPGSPVGSCASHTDHRDKVGTGPVNRRSVAAARRPSCLLHRRRCVAEPVHASTTSNRSSSTPSLLHVTRSGLSAIKAGSWAEPLPQAFVLPASLRT